MCVSEIISIPLVPGSELWVGVWKPSPEGFKLASVRYYATTAKLGFGGAMQVKFSKDFDQP